MTENNENLDQSNNEKIESMQRQIINFGRNIKSLKSKNDDLKSQVIEFED